MVGSPVAFKRYGSAGFDSCALSLPASMVFLLMPADMSAAPKESTAMSALSQFARSARPGT
jgi:hypothetical protein